MKLSKKVLSLLQKSRAKHFSFPNRSQWKGLLRVFSKKEKVLFFSLILLFLASLFLLTIDFYFKHTEIIPAPGGIYKEAIEGEPRIINPIYATSDAERDLIEIIFSGLMKYNQEGEIVPDLAERYEIKEEGKVYEFELKKNLKWSDGEPLTTDDIVFTVKVLQDPAFKSPYLASWLGVKAEKISPTKLRFYLKKPYFSFLELCTFKILPKHIWEQIPAQNFPLAIYNLKPVGSGPYKVEEIEQDDLGYITSVTLKRNPYYFKTGPYLDKIILSFHKKEEEVFKKALNQEIKGFSLQSLPENIPLNFELKPMLLPRYFALFFNQEETEILSDKRVRQALNYATNREAILEKVLQGKGQKVSSPILPEIYGFSPPEKKYSFDQEKARELLIEAGFKKINQQGIREKIVKEETVFEFKKDLKVDSQGQEVKELQQCLSQDTDVYPEGEVTGYFGSLTKKAVINFQEKYASEILSPYGLKEGTGKVGPSTRKKLNELCARVSTETLPLKLTLVTVDQPQLKKVAQLLKEQWQELQIDLEVKFLPLAELEQNYLRPRRYEILLFGQVLGTMPDLYPFWYSEQAKDPGLNLALYKNKEVDELLIRGRQAKDWETLKENYEKVQEIILKDPPAVFLYNPYYLYFQSPAIKGFKTKFIADPSKRFANIEEWYLKTKRKWK